MSAASLLTSPNAPTTPTPPFSTTSPSALTTNTGLVVSAPANQTGVVYKWTGAGTQQAQTMGSSHVVGGGEFSTLGGGATQGRVANRRYAFISLWVSGQTYQQWAVVQSSVAPFAAYTKTTAGPLVSTVDPSLDAVNWALLSGTGGSAVFNGNEMVVESVFLQGDGPTVIEWLTEGGLEPAMTLVGHPANALTDPAALTVDGSITARSLALPTTGAAATAGRANVALGTVTVNTTAITAGTDIVLLTQIMAADTPTTFFVVKNIVSGVSFDIVAVDATGMIDIAINATIGWMIVKIV